MSVVGAKLDYCNAVLYGASAKTIAVLQRLQNNMARVVLRTTKFSHATPLLQQLHWLPVKQRISFKLAVLTYKVRSTSPPLYLSSLLSDRPASCSMTLRSACRPVLQVDNARTVYGSRAFHIAAPTVWNRLPVDVIRSPSIMVFKKHLKTFLFENCL